MIEMAQSMRLEALFAAVNDKFSKLLTKFVSNLNNQHISVNTIQPDLVFYIEVSQLICIEI